MKLWSSNTQLRRLPSGLTLVVQPVPDLPAAAVVSRVAAGFFDEPDALSGISHVLEHMFFKGTRARGVGEIARETKALGGYLNAGTAYDYTVYYAVLPARSLAEAAAIQADALRHPLLDGAELEREIGVILEEARRKLDEPSSVAHETLHAELFDRHRIRRWRIGSEATLTGLTRDQLADYHRTRYVPERTVVAVVGGVEAQATLDVLERHYGDWDGGPARLDPSPAEPPRRERRVRTTRGDVQQADLVVGWRGVPARHPDATALDLAAAVLSAGRASRLYRTLRDPGVASAASAWSYSPTEVGVFGVSLDLAPDRITEALGLVAAEVHRLRQDRPDTESLERARTLLRTRWARRFESAEGRAMELAAAQAHGGVELVDEDYRRLLDTTPEQVRDVAARYLDPEAVAAVAYLPRDRGDDLTLQAVERAFESPGPAVSLPPRTARSVAPVTPATRPRPRRQPVAGVHHLPLAGADILVCRHRGAPLISVGLFRRRLGFDSAPLAGLGALSVRSAVRGAGNLAAAELAEAFEAQGGTLAPTVTTEWYGFQTSVLPDRLDQAAWLLGLVLETPTLAELAVATERDLLADDAAQSHDDMMRRPIQLAAAAAFGEAGYGLPLLGEPGTVRQLAGAQVRTWHARHAAAGRTLVVAVGDLEPEEALDRLAGRVDHHPRRTDVTPPAPGETTGVPWPRRRVESRDKAQTGLAMLFPGPTRLAPDRHAAEVWAALAGGLGGRLFEALRDRRSLAYTVAAFPWQRRRMGALLTYIATTPARESEARDAMLEELARLREVPPPADEVAQAARYLAGQAEVARQRAGAVMGEILDAWLEGTGLAEMEDPAGPYMSVRAEQVHDVARTYLDPDRRAEGVVRGGWTNADQRMPNED